MAARVVIAAHAMFHICCGAATQSLFSSAEGMHSESEYLNPGKIDVLYKHQQNVNQFNGFLWTPVFKGGGGVIAPKGALNTRYGGGYFRPLPSWPEKGDLIIGTQAAETGPNTLFELQAEYRLPCGFGFGGGFFSTPSSTTDVRFGKLTYRNKWQEWDYVFEVQAQSAGNEVEPGGYIAFFDDQWMGAVGSDGEQWRVTTAYIASDRLTRIRPVLETIYVDNSIGKINGAKVVFANASLKFEGGFLGNPSRMARAMGPQGLEFGNPLGFVTSTFNRRLEVWEIGGLSDLRMERIELPTGAVQERYEGCIYPAQFQSSRSMLDGCFVGAAWSKSPVRNTPGIFGGFFFQVGFLRLSIGVERQMDPAETSVVIGLIDRF